jgi:hypothetical protein
MKTMFFMPYLMVVLLCLSFGSCENIQAPKEGKKDVEVANSKNGSKKEEPDSLIDATDAMNDTQVMKKKEVILRKTKAQYVIY